MIPRLAPAYIFGRVIETARHRHPQRFSTVLPPSFGDSLDQYLVSKIIK
jgi:hypothetical protein